MNTTATPKDSVGTSSAQMNPSMMILSELLSKKLGHVDVIVVDVIIIVVAVIFVLIVFLFTMTLPLSLEGWNVEAKMAQFENYVNDHLRYYKDQVRRS